MALNQSERESDVKKETLVESIDASKFFQIVHGTWSGCYRLWLDPSKESEDSDTEAEIRFVAKSKFVLFTYTWQQAGQDQAGVFLLGGDQQQVTATWGDSWHMAPEPMICNGSLVDKGQKVVLNGHYSAGDQKWGWRTEFSLKEADTLFMQAFNISPDGREMLAVESEMSRTSASS